MPKCFLRSVGLGQRTVRGGGSDATSGADQGRTETTCLRVPEVPDDNLSFREPRSRLSLFPLVRGAGFRDSVNTDGFWKNVALRLELNSNIRPKHLDHCLALVCCGCAVSVAGLVHGHVYDFYAKIACTDKCLFSRWHNLCQLAFTLEQP